MADFGNPLVLGGNFEVLSTKIFFAVVGAAARPGPRRVLAIVLLIFTLGAFWAAARWLGRASYTTVTGKGDAGLPVPLPRGLRWLCYGIAIPWAALHARIYIMIFVGGFVKSMGPRLHADAGPLPHRLRHRMTAAAASSRRGLEFVLHHAEDRAIAAPLTAASAC
jgi:ABC-type Fe3+ transport system permease subunit